jgi:hypothetical protein
MLIANRLGPHGGDGLSADIASTLDKKPGSVAELFRF